MRITPRTAILLAAVLIATVGLAVPMATEAQEALAAQVAADFQQLVAGRDALVAALEKKPAAQEVLLRFDEGADHDDLWLTLRRADGAWREAYGEVLGWHQATMKDWREYYHANFTYGCWRPNLRFPADTANLTLDAQRLAGVLDMTLRLDWPDIKRLPPGQPVQWWDRFIPGGHTVARKASYTLDAEVRADSCLLDLVLEGGVYFDSAFVPDAKKPPAGHSISRRPIFLRMQVPSGRFVPVWVRTPGWVPGFHEADTTGLKFANGRLTGKLIVLLHQDGWGPWGGGGKHTQHEPITVTFDVDARLDHNELSGHHTAFFGGVLKGKHYSPGGGDPASVELPNTRYDGAIRGVGGKLVAGRYAVKGDLGEQAGAVDGMLLDAPRPLREQVKLPDGGATAANVATLLRQIRALHLALQDAALPYAEAWQQAERPAPADAELAPYLSAALRQVSALPEPNAKLPAAIPETEGDSPSYGVKAAPVEAENVNVLPADSRDWLFLPQWRVLGPFQQRPGLEHDTALAPDLVVLPGAKYQQATDRTGAEVDKPAAQAWLPVVCTSPRLGAPWERSGIWPRYVGQVWYGAATLRSEQARTVWLSLEANDFAKLWVNDRLVWTDTERDWRYRSFGRVFVPVALAAGENQVLARVHSDRNLSWLRLALSGREPAAPARASARPAAPNPLVFPDANPPLGWDLAKGSNVAWRNEELGGRTRPVILGDALVLTRGTGTLTCVDAATGQPRWSQVLEQDPTALPAKGEGPRAGPPVSDGQRVAFLSGSGTLGCYDAAGKQLWSQPAQLSPAQVVFCGERLILEGQAARADKRGGVAGSVRVVALDPANGKDAWRRDTAGAFGHDGQALSVSGAAVYLSCTGAALDAATGQPFPAFDCEMQLTDKDGAAVRSVTEGPYRVHSSAGMLYLTSQSRHLAVRLWMREGQLGWAHVWESNYGSSGFFNVPVPGTATDRFLFTWHSSLAHTPHCPDPRAEVNVQDVRDGRWLNRVKPVMTDLYSYGALNLSTPVVAGPYVFLLGGRSDNHRNQIAVVSADERLQPIARQDVEPGTTQPPLFAGSRMFLRSPQSLLCIAATTPEGRQYEKLAQAQTVLRTLGREPRDAPPAEVTALDRVRPGSGVPVAKLLNERPVEWWLGAGPFPPGSLNDAAALAALRPETGAAFVGKTFAPLSREFAYREPPAYLRTSELQGTGDITPHFYTQVDPQGISGPNGPGLLYTILDNTRDRVLEPLLRRKGVTQWLGGQLLDPDAYVRLRPGLYPYLVKIEPEYYQAVEPEVLPPVEVVAALDKSTLRDIGWPKTWQVFGPLSALAAPLKETQLREFTAGVTAAGQTYRLFPFEAKDNAVDLGCLVYSEAGEPPDRASSFVRPGVPLAAYAFGAVECPADGYLYVTASCDNNMCWYLDGAPVYDRLREGNGAPASDIKAHPFAARVTRGRHVVAVQVRPSSSGWSFCSAGGFSEKSGDQLGEFRVPSKITPRSRDLRLQPCFREIPHPDVLRQVWLDRARANQDRLREAAEGLPGTREAGRAQAMLEGLKQ